MHDCLRKKWILSFGMLFSGGRGFFIALSAAGSARGSFNTLRHMPGSQPSSVAVLWAFNTAELAPFFKGLRSASVSRVGARKTPTLEFLVIFHTPLRFPIFLSAPRSPAHCTISVQLFLFLLLPATAQLHAASSSSSSNNNTYFERHTYLLPLAL